MRCVLPLRHALAPCMVHGIGMHVMHHIIIVVIIIMLIMLIVDHHVHHHVHCSLFIDQSMFIIHCCCSLIVRCCVNVNSVRVDEWMVYILVGVSC